MQTATYVIIKGDGERVPGRLNYRYQRKLTPAMVRRRVAKEYNIPETRIVDVVVNGVAEATVPFENNKGEVRELPAQMTLGELARQGIHVSIVKPDAPLPDGAWRSLPEKK